MRSSTVRLWRVVQLASLAGILWTSQACHSARRTYQLIVRQAGEERQIQDAPVLSIRLHWHPYQFRITHASGRREWMPASQLWGYRGSDGSVFRLYEGRAYEVVQQRTVTVYRQTEWGGDSVKENYYFSRTPDAPIFYLDRKNLELAFTDSPCMHDLIRQMPATSWLRKNSAGYYRLIDAFHHCQQQDAIPPPIAELVP